MPVRRRGAPLGHQLQQTRHPSQKMFLWPGRDGRRDRQLHNESEFHLALLAKARGSRNDFSGHAPSSTANPVAQDEGKGVLKFTAEDLMRRAVEGNQELLGVGHPTTLTSVFELGMLQAVQGRLSEAEANMTRALQGVAHDMGPHHPNTLALCAQLADVLFAHEVELDPMREDPADGKDPSVLDAAASPCQPRDATLAAVTIRDDAGGNAWETPAVTFLVRSRGHTSKDASLPQPTRLAQLLRLRSHVAAALDDQLGPEAPETQQAVQQLVEALEHSRVEEHAALAAELRSTCHAIQTAVASQAAPPLGLYRASIIRPMSTRTQSSQGVHASAPAKEDEVSRVQTRSGSFSMRVVRQQRRLQPNSEVAGGDSMKPSIATAASSASVAHRAEEENAGKLSFELRMRLADMLISPAW